MRMFRHSLAAAAALALAACGPPGSEAEPPVAEPPAHAPGAGGPGAGAPGEGAPEAGGPGLEGLFEQSAREFGVPAELLKAVSYVETRWQMVKGEQEFEGVAPAYGLLALRGQALERGAALAGVEVEAVRTEPRAHLRAGAALLRAYAEELGLRREELGAWAPAVARLSGITDEDALAHYVHTDVYGVLRQGAVAQGEGGQVLVALMPTEVQAWYARPRLSALAAGPDYASSIWRPSPNFNARPTGATGVPQMIVIHTCEGSYTGCRGWLVNSAAKASAHYVVKEDGSEISQLVREADRAWHVAASYDCTLNGSVRCNHGGVSVNHFSIGIEHAGFANQGSFPAGQIDASARLTCDISRDRNIPRDSYHIVAHGRLQPYNRTDPGPHWPWSTYLSKVNGYCGASTSLFIDSNNASNDTSRGYIEVSSSWASSSVVSGYYGTGYWYAQTQSMSDPATFWFYLPAAATKTVDAWWTAGTDRSTNAPFIVYNSQGTRLSTVYVNQQAGGSRWNTLGTWRFTAGWNKVQLSRWTTAGSVVVADALQVR